MTQDISLLFGLHESEELRFCRIGAEADHFKVYEASTLEQMRRLMAAREYQGYLMDLNLGEPGSFNLTSAREMYALVQPRVEREQAVFLGVSGREDIVRQALQEKIPAEEKPFHLFPFLEHCHRIAGKY